MLCIMVKNYKMTIQNGIIIEETKDARVRMSPETLLTSDLRVSLGKKKKKRKWVTDQSSRYINFSV